MSEAISFPKCTATPFRKLGRLPVEAVELKDEEFDDDAERAGRLEGGGAMWEGPGLGDASSSSELCPERTGITYKISFKVN